MKIGYVGGKLDGCMCEPEFCSNENSLGSTVRHEDEERTHWKAVELIKQGVKNNDAQKLGKQYDTYRLMILRKNGVAKLFYVLDGLTREQVKENIEENWIVSDPVGYDFD